MKKLIVIIVISAFAASCKTYPPRKQFGYGYDYAQDKVKK